MHALAPGSLMLTELPAVAVVARDPDYLRHIRAVLTGTGYQPLRWPDDDHLIDRLQRTSVDLLIIDVQPAPAHGGWSELLTMHQHVATRCQPIVACTSVKQRLQAIVDQLGETRCAVVQKPVTAADLVESLREMWMMRVG